MSNTITNEQLVAEQGLLTFFLVQSESEAYDDFRSFYDGIVSMVAHKHFGWTETITESGYEQVVEAYKALHDTGFFDDDSEIYG